MKYSPQPSNFVQLPPPSLQMQEQLMSSLMSQIAESGFSHYRSRALLFQQKKANTSAINSTANSSNTIDVINIPSARAVNQF